MLVPTEYLLVALLGALVGAVEIVSRYRDQPWSALWGTAAIAYMALNGGASCAALGLIRTFGAPFSPTDASQSALLEILAAGLAGTALLRASFFFVRVGDRDVGIGPAALLQVLLFATDRDVDRKRAVRRAQNVPKALEGLKYEEVRDALPQYCLILMQNVTRDEEHHLQRELESIRASSGDDATKAVALGMSLVNVVGQRVLESAAEAFRSRSISGGVLGDVYPRLRTVCAKVTDPRARTLDILGLTMYTTWPHIKTWIEMGRHSPLRGWRVNLWILDSDFVAFHADWFPAHWPAEANTLVGYIEDFVRERKELMRSAKIELSLSTYRMLPAVQGTRTGAGHYFVTFMRWEKETAVAAGAHHNFEFIHAEDHGPRAEDVRQLYDNWLARAEQARTRVTRSGTGRAAKRRLGLRRLARKSKTP
jgi:hypothetical protein